MKTMNLHNNENDKQVMNTQEQQMTSLEIARLAGKQHKHVMEAIRRMEPAWINVNGSNFRLVDYRDAKGQLRPCYSLTKAETLYIATKFHDEARARLVLRWEELERQRWMTRYGGALIVNLSGSTGAQVFFVVPTAGVLLPTRMLEWRPWHGPVRRLVCRTAHGIVREGVDDYTLYVRLPKTILEMLDTTPQEVLDAEVARLLELMNS